MRQEDREKERKRGREKRKMEETKVKGRKEHSLLFEGSKQLFK